MFMCVGETFSHLYSLWDASLRVDAASLLFVCVSVTRAMTECMLVPRAKAMRVMNEPHSFLLGPTGAKAK